MWKVEGVVMVEGVKGVKGAEGVEWGKAGQVRAGLGVVIVSDVMDKPSIQSAIDQVRLLRIQRPEKNCPRIDVVTFCGFRVCSKEHLIILTLQVLVLGFV